MSIHRERAYPRLRCWTSERALNHLAQLEYLGSTPTSNMRLSTVFKHLHKFIGLAIDPPRYTTQPVPVRREPLAYNPEDDIIELIDKKYEKELAT